MEDIITPTVTGKCIDCNLWRSSAVSNGLYSCNKLMGVGDKPAPIMFVASYPNEDEVKQKKPFVGIEGQLLKKYAQVVGINNYYATYLSKCKPEFGKTPTTSEMNTCGKYLLEEIKEVSPKVIVVLGGAILPFFGVESKITQARGIPVWNDKFNCYVLPTYSPAYLNNFVEQSRQRKEFCEDLAKALKLISKGVEQKIEVNYKYASTIAEVEAMTKQLLQVDWFSADTETDSLNYLKARLLLNSFSYQEGQAFVIPYLHPKGFNEQGQKEVKPYLDKIYNSSVNKIFQGGKFDTQIIISNKIPLQRYAFDTMIAHSLLDENSPHGLDKIVPIYTDMGNYKDEVGKYISGKVKILKENIIQEGPHYFKVTEEKGVKVSHKVCLSEAIRSSNILDCPYDELLKYSAQDADATFRLFKVFWPMLEEEGLLKLLIKVNIPLSYVLANMEYTGIGGNIEYARETADKLRNEMTLAEANILASKQVAEFMKKYQVPNNKFNVNSSNQKGKLFFDIMKLKPTKFNKVTPLQKEKGVKKGSPSTDAESLDLMLQENKIKLLEDFITIGKMKKSKEYMEEYTEILSTSVDGRIHTSFNQIKTDEGGTITGRLSSKAPNLQNIPSHNPEKAKLTRTVFSAKPGYTFIEADYKVIEFRIWAHASNDSKMLEFLNDPKADIHKKIASQAYKLPEEQITKTLRDVAKMTVYGMIYGRSTYSIAKEYGMDEDEVNRFVNGFFRMFPQATEYIEKNIALMEKQGYITNIFGRRRRVLNIYSKDKKLKEAAQRQTRNFPLQSGAADLIFVAMVKLFKALLPYDAKLILQIHDSLIVEIKDEQLNEVIPVVINIMESAVKLRCKIPVEVEIGKNLGDMKLWVPGI